MQFLKRIYNFCARITTNKLNLDSRKLRIFVSNKIVLNLIRLLAIVIIITVLSLLYIYNFEPKLLQKIKNQSIGTISQHININNEDIRIKITGTKRSNKNVIMSTIRKSYKSNREYLINNFSKLVSTIKRQQKWIESIHIFRSLPNIINVEITEYIPFAIWESNNNTYIVDSNGSRIKIDNSEDYDSLIVLSGPDAYTHVKSLFNIMAINPDISSKIYSATWVGNRRWNLRLDNSLLVKLPANNINKSWNKLVELYQTKGSFYNLEVIDLRVENKIYLEYKDNIY